MRHLREAGCAPSSFQHRFEEGLTARDRALRQDHHEVTGLERCGRFLQRFVGTAAALDANAAHGAGHVADDRRVEDFLLAEKAHRPAPPGHRVADGQRIEVTPMVAADDGGPLGGNVVDAFDLDARIGHELGASEREDRLLGFEAEELRDTWRHVEILHRPPAQQRERA